MTGLPLNVVVLLKSQMEKKEYPNNNVKSRTILELS